MKNKTTFFLIILILGLISLTIYLFYDTNNKKIEQPIESPTSIINQNDNIRFIVLARSGCHYCEIYKPIIDEIKNDYNLKIEYIDVIKDDSILKEEIIIPSYCNNKGKDIKINEGFGTPLTLFLKDGKVIDCIRGYTKKENIIDKLKEVYNK